MRWLLWCCAVWASVASGQVLPVAQGDGVLWWVRPTAENDPGRLMFRRDGDPAGRIYPRLATPWVPALQAASASGRSVWLAAKDAVLRVRLVEGPANRVLLDVTPTPRLPAGVVVRSIAVSGGSAWVLVRVPDEAGWAALVGAAGDAGGMTDEQVAVLLRVYDVGMVRAWRESALARRPGGMGGTPAEAGEPVWPEGVVGPRDALLRLDRSRWRPVALPADWPGSAKAVLVGVAEGPPALLRVGDGEAGGLYRWEAPARRGERGGTAADAGEPGGEPGEPVDAAPPAGGWVLSPLDVPATQAALVDRQWVLAGRANDDEPSGLRLRLWTLRGGETLPLATVDLGVTGGASWRLVSDGGAARLYAAERPRPVAPGRTPDDAVLVSRRLDLLGNVDVEASLTERRVGAVERSADLMILMLVLVVSTAVVLVVWPNEVKRRRLALPVGVGLATPVRRLVGGLVDLVPCLYLAAWQFDISLEELAGRWPGTGHAEEARHLLPGLAAAGYYTAHTTLSELVFRRSLGKLVTGTRLTTHAGDRPGVGAVLVRGVMKPIDLFGLPLMSIVLFHHHQRFADLLARTVVVHDVAARPGEDAGRVD